MMKVVECCVDAKPLAVTVNGSVDDPAAAAVDNSVDTDDNRWEQVRSRNRTVFNNTVSIHLLHDVLGVMSLVGGLV